MLSKKCLDFLVSAPEVLTRTLEASEPGYESPAHVWEGGDETNFKEWERCFGNIWWWWYKPQHGSSHPYPWRV